MSARAMSGPVTELPSAREIEVRGIVQGVGFRPFVWRLASGAGLTGRVRNRSGVVEIVVEGRLRLSTTSARRSRRRRPSSPAWIRSRGVTPRRPGSRPSMWTRASSGSGGTAGFGGRRHVRELPGRAVRTERPPVPVPVHQLHRLRAALHHHRGAPLRPRAHEHARVPDVRRLRPRVSTTRPTAGSTRSRSPAPPAAAPGAPRPSGWHAGRRPDRAGGDAPGRRRDRRAEGARWVPPRLRRDRRVGGLCPPGAEASTGQALRGDGRRPGRRGRAVRLERPRADRAVVLASADRPRPGPRHARALRGTWPSSAGSDAAIHAAPPPAAPRGRPPVGHDERQSQRRADLHRGRGGARAARRRRRRVPRPRPRDRRPLRRQRRARLAGTRARRAQGPEPSPRHRSRSPARSPRRSGLARNCTAPSALRPGGGRISPSTSGT